MGTGPARACPVGGDHTVRCEPPKGRAGGALATVAFGLVLAKVTNPGWYLNLMCGCQFGGVACPGWYCNGVCGCFTGIWVLLVALSN